MANVNLYIKFDYTDADGNVYSDGSTTTAKTINIDGGEIFDRTYSVATATITEILSDAMISDFDFLYIESDQAGEIQLVCNEYDGSTGGTLSGDNIENGFCLGVTAGIPIVLSNDDSRNMGNMNGTFNESNHQSEIDTWETNWAVDTIDRIEWYHSTGVAAKVRVIAIT
tara:strand:+ start:2806 stop:3312 length:507 start_codon:yes stop_codon:yes gene_type:complete